MYSIASFLGLFSAGLFVTSFFAIALATPGYDLFKDYISLLGASGQPFALWWNLLGFVSVGFMFAAFGWAYSRVVNDIWVGVFLMISGIGFAMGAIPADFINPDLHLSKAHFVSICLALAGWCLGLARIDHIRPGPRIARISATLAGTFVVLTMIATALGLISAPIAHRLVLVAVFGWVIFTSMQFVMRKKAFKIEDPDL